MNHAKIDEQYMELISQTQSDWPIEILSKHLEGDEEIESNIDPNREYKEDPMFTIPDKLFFDKVKSVTCKTLCVTQKDVYGDGRKQEWVDARRITLYFWEYRLRFRKLALREVGEMLGQWLISGVGDHATVIHYRKSLKFLVQDREFSAKLKRVQTALEKDMTDFMKYARPEFFIVEDLETATQEIIGRYHA